MHFLKSHGMLNVCLILVEGDSNVRYKYSNFSRFKSLITLEMYETHYSNSIRMLLRVYLKTIA